MMKTVLLILAVGIAAVGFADEKDPAYWYGDGYSDEDTLATFVFEKEGEQTLSSHVAFVKNKDGSINWDKTATIPNAFKLAADAAKTAIEAKLAAKSIADKLAALEWDDKEAEVTDTASGAKTAGEVKNSPARFDIYAPNILGGGAQADMTSINTNNVGNLQLKQFHIFNAESGYFPMTTGTQTGMAWQYFDEFLDGDTIKADCGSGFRSKEPIKDATHHGIHLAGWYAPEAAPNKCDDTIASIITNAQLNTSHYVLTKRVGTTEDGQLHYMRIGTLGDLGGGSALRVKGTSGDVTVGSGSVTNTINLVSASDSNVQFAVSVTNGNEIAVAVGVYWK